MPGVSKVWLSGTTPSHDQRSCEFQPGIAGHRGGQAHRGRRVAAEGEQRRAFAQRDAGAARRAARRAVLARVPRIARRAVMRVVAGAAERELHHVGLAHQGGELPAQVRDHRPLGLELLRQASRRARKSRKSRHREQVLHRDRDALQRAGDRAGRKGRVGRIGAFARMVGRPLRIGHEGFAAALVIGDRLLGERARREGAVAQAQRELGDGT